jgi:tRNA A-37 threonylcarbamoyl transferase component Bud32
MSETDYLKETIQTLELAKNDLLRLYSYGLTPSDIRRLCTSVTTPGDVVPMTITPLGRGEFGSADIVDYKGKQYVRKSQPMVMKDWMAAQEGMSADYNPFENEIGILRELNTHKTLYKYVPVYYGHEREGGTGIYIMEYLQGETFEGLCEKRGVNQKDLDTILGQIESILRELHTAGYVFGDATSANFFIRMNEDNTINVVLIDFGYSSHINQQKTQAYEQALRQYEEIPKNKRFGNEPFPSRNIVAHNWKFLEYLKFGLREKFGIPACVRPGKDGKELPPLSKDDLGYRPRDFETKNVFTEQQKAQLAALDSQIQELNLDLARQQQVAPKLVSAPFARQALELRGAPLPPMLMSAVPRSQYENLASRVAGVGQQALKVAEPVTSAPGRLIKLLTGPFTRTGGKRKQRNKRKQRKTRKSKV